MNIKSLTSIPSKLRFRPWVFLVIAFMLLITAWSTIIVIAIRHSPERINIVKPSTE